MRAALLAFLLVACHPPAPAPPSPPSGLPAGYAACQPAPLPMPTDVCDGLFTADGLACVRCGAAQGCFDQSDSVYCVTGGCRDARCGAP